MRLLDEGANLVFNTTKDGTGVGTAGNTIPLQYTYEINLRNVIGKDDYDNHNFFAICLNSVATYMLVTSYSITGIISGQSGSTPVQVGMSGLPFLNSTTNSNLDNTVLFPDVFNILGGNTVATASATRIFSNPKMKRIIFRKPRSSNVTITISIFGMRGSAPSNIIIAANSTSTTETTSDFSFTIYPVVEE